MKSHCLQCFQNGKDVHPPGTVSSYLEAEGWLSLGDFYQPVFQCYPSREENQILNILNLFPSNPPLDCKPHEGRDFATFIPLSPMLGECPAHSRPSMTIY